MVFLPFSKQLNDYNTLKKNLNMSLRAFFFFLSWFFYYFQSTQGKLVF